jgi:type VI secretion system secreted protein Hcp
MDAMKTLTQYLLVPFLSCVLAASAHGAFDAFLKIDGIEGDSTDEMHPNEIVVLNFKLGVMQGLSTSAFGGGAGAGKAQFSPVNIFKLVDKATPKLFMACAGGQHIQTATLVVRKAGENPIEYFKVTLTDVFISSLNEDSETTDQQGNVVETLTLNFSRIQWTFTPQNADGGTGAAITGGYDLKTNKAL